MSNAEEEVSDGAEDFNTQGPDTAPAGEVNVARGSAVHSDSFEEKEDRHTEGLGGRGEAANDNAAIDPARLLSYFIAPKSSIDDTALCNLIVNYLPPMMDERAAAQLFSNFGPIVSVKIIYDKDSGESRGYGFIRFEFFFSATYAIVALNRYEIAGKTLKVAYANAAGARKALSELQAHGVTDFTDLQKQVFLEYYPHLLRDL